MFDAHCLRARVWVVYKLTVIGIDSCVFLLI